MPLGEFCGNPLVKVGGRRCPRPNARRRLRRGWTSRSPGVQRIGSGKISSPWRTPQGPNRHSLTPLSIAPPRGIMSTRFPRIFLYAPAIPGPDRLPQPEKSGDGPKISECREKRKAARCCISRSASCIAPSCRAASSEECRAAGQRGPGCRGIGAGPSRSCAARSRRPFR